MYKEGSKMGSEKPCVCELKRGTTGESIGGWRYGWMGGQMDGLG
jgi:hypothetical protein